MCRVIGTWHPSCGSDLNDANGCQRRPAKLRAWVACMQGRVALMIQLLPCIFALRTHRVVTASSLKVVQVVDYCTSETSSFFLRVVIQSSALLPVFRSCSIMLCSSIPLEIMIHTHSKLSSRNPGRRWRTHCRFWNLGWRQSSSCLPYSLSNRPPPTHRPAMNRMDSLSS